MIDVLVALLPVALVSVLLFGYRALLTMVIAMISAMLAEAVWLRKLDLFGDGSAAVTGLLLAMTLPPAPPWWWWSVLSAPLLSATSIRRYRQQYFQPGLVGGLSGCLLGRPYGRQIWPVPKPFAFGVDVSAVTTATPLAGQEQALNTALSQLFIGNVAGALGETSALALLVGAFWLLYKGHIDWRIPGGYIITVFVMGAALGGGFYGNHLLTGLFHVLAGGVLLGALFMATDMVTSPVTNLGKLIFGIGCGVITMLIRLFGAFPEGVTFAILIMNALTPIIDNFTIPRKFGEVKKSA